jgi:hypothetical protein
MVWVKDLWTSKILGVSRGPRVTKNFGSRPNLIAVSIVVLDEEHFKLKKEIPLGGTSMGWPICETLVRYNNGSRDHKKKLKMLGPKYQNKLQTKCHQEQKTEWKYLYSSRRYKHLKNTYFLNFWRGAMTLKVHRKILKVFFSFVWEQTTWD